MPVSLRAPDRPPHPLRPVAVLAEAVRAAQVLRVGGVDYGPVPTTPPTTLRDRRDAGGRRLRPAQHPPRRQVRRQEGRGESDGVDDDALLASPSADLDVAVQGVVFPAAGTTEQRCTTLRHFIVHRDIADTLVARLTAAYARLPRQPVRREHPRPPAHVHQRPRRHAERRGQGPGTGRQILAGGNRRLAEAAPQNVSFL